MAKDPAVLFYTSDFLSGVAFFTMEQRGQYITLLCEQHQHFSIPENHMISICGSIDSIVIKKFTKDTDGTYYNERMRIEAERRKTFCESRSNNKAGRKPKESYDKSLDKSYDKKMIIHMETENEDIIVIKNTITKLCNNKAEIVFKKFDEWKRYLLATHGTEIKENIFAYQTLERNLKTFGIEGYIKAVENSIDKNYKQIYAPKENKDTDTYIPPYKKIIL